MGIQYVNGFLVLIQNCTVKEAYCIKYFKKNEFFQFLYETK